ncbi:MAG: fibronectin type III domain-containing protein, partial [Thermoleophilia bacterium]|nr:fibronectin type III domain-containing protein [Thermoleophilia bacterium]
LVFAASESPSERASAPGKIEAAKKSAGKPLRFADSNLFVEINGTDGDAGLQAEMDGEPWRKAIVLDPKGRKLLDFRGEGRMRNWGLTGLSFESAEPGFDEIPLAKFRARFPQGKYRFRGRTIDGKLIIGSARLTHVFPKRPKVLFPTPDAVVPVGDLTVRWEPVTKPAGVKIVDYEVILGGDGGESASIELPSTATSLTLPGELLKPASEYAIEVLAREKSGNRTITEVPFTTG